MAGNTFTTANNILNRVAAEIGQQPVADAYSSQDPLFIQMQYLLNTAGEELVYLYEWETLNKQATFTTQIGDSGDYDLPDDFAYMINQTGWVRNQNVPLMGPLSPQDWQYLLGRNLVSSTIYASFRQQENLLRLFPQPPPEGLDIAYEYISKNWVNDPTLGPGVYTDAVTKTTDIVLYDKTLISRYLKVKILESKGFDTTKAQDDFNQIFMSLTGNDKGAPILNMGRWGAFPYLDAYRNVPDTNYGLP